MTCSHFKGMHNLIHPFTVLQLRHIPQSRRRCVFSAAAEVMFVYNSLVIHRHPHPLPSSLFSQSHSLIPFLTVYFPHLFSHSPLPSSLFSQSTSRVPFLTVPFQSPFLHHLNQAHRACGCLHGVKLSFASYVCGACGCLHGVMQVMYVEHVAVYMELCKLCMYSMCLHGVKLRCTSCH